MKSPLSNISKRERLMLGALLAAGVLIWISLFMKRWKEVNTELTNSRATVDEQYVWLQNLPQFESMRNKVLSQLDRQKTLSASQLSGWFDRLAREHETRYTVNPPKVQTDNLFTRNTIEARMNNVPLVQWLSMESAIRAMHPYLSINELTITANPADQRLMNVRLSLSSFEIK